MITQLLNSLYLQLHWHGSELSFISKDSVDLLNIKRQHSTIPILGVGGTHSTQTLGKAQLTLRTIYKNLTIRITAHIIRQVSTLLPSEECEQRQWQHTEKLNLADPTFWKPQPVDVLIGADYYGQIIKPNLIRGSVIEPIAQLSIFGWLLIGPSNSAVQHKVVYHTTAPLNTEDLQELLTRFWVQEEPPSTSAVKLNKEDALCEQHFAETHTRDTQGRYQVRLPLTESADVLGNSFGKAQACLKRILIKCNQNSIYKERYYSFMDEYCKLGHMVRIPQQDISTKPSYYLPHHGVLREDSLTTKLRAVFNGSALTTTGKSLNDIMHTGPNLSPNIVDVLIWIRTQPFVFSTDVTKMYRQIKVHPQDWNLQRILWVDETGQLTHFHLTTVTYGTRAAPYLAIRTLLQLVKDEGDKYPLAIDSLLFGRYVDDIFGGAASTELLIEKAKQLTALCKAGGFPLAKWNSNSSGFLKEFLKESTAEEAVLLDDCATNILGMKWLPHSDKLTFRTTLPPLQEMITKRIILSEVSQLYDPIGIISPVIITSKILLQELWLHKLSWDESLPNSIVKKWLHIRKDLTHLKTIALPRWLGIQENSIVELHGFSDASQQAMAAVLYIKSTTPNSHSTSSVLISKTKVAPLKRLSNPRLELGAAVLLTKLAKHVLDYSRLPISHIHLWTDAKVALTWIRSHPSKWKDFVGNRVALIQELIPTAQWRHVPGADNPADCASRGLLTSQLREHQLWWHGPSWLCQEESAWPSQASSIQETNLPEMRAKVTLTAAKSNSSKLWDIIDYYSSLTQLIRITGWVMLACDRFKAKGKTHHESKLTTDLLIQAKLFWVKKIQQVHFHSELIMLKNSQVPRNHVFNRLTAYIDSIGIVRVGGRLQKTQLDHHSKHPAIIPRSSQLTTLIIRNAHLSTLHGGAQLTLAHTRQEFWIIGGRAPVKSHILKCVTCARYRAQRAQQLMGQLPMARVTPSPPFTHTGIDYAGPITINSWKGRGSKTYKGWICIFVCFSTSAVHLELVSDYSTDGFLAAYRRFTSRRGIPSKLYSDCGTNFIGAARELKTLFSQHQHENSILYNSLANEGTQWIFNPPAAPHMGGKWEAVVKSVKFHLRRTIGDTQLTFEASATLLTQIEALLNSRPLEPLSEDPEDINALTPGHFLIGKALNSVPEPSLLTFKESRLSKWQLIQRITQQFWKHWSTQYLQRLQSISKWHHPSHEIKVGSMVLLTDEHSPPSKWPLARVTQLHPGTDNLTRVVTIKTATTQLTRPIAKLAILPVPIGI